MSFDGPSSTLRHLSAADFSAEQVAGWCDAAGASGEEAAPAPGEPEEWYVAYTNPRRERAVAETARRRSFQAYIPTMTVTRGRADVCRPPLPRYVFIGLRAPLTLFGLRETPGLEGMVKCSGKPVVAPPSVIRALQAEEAEGVYDFSDERIRSAYERAEAERRTRAWQDKLKAFVPGTELEVVSGRWLSFKGRVLDGLPPDRIWVEIVMLGRACAIPLMLDEVERAT